MALEYGYMSYTTKFQFFVIFYLQIEMTGEIYQAISSFCLKEMAYDLKASLSSSLVTLPVTGKDYTKWPENQGYSKRRYGTVYSCASVWWRKVISYVYCIEFSAPWPCIGIPSVFTDMKIFFPHTLPFICLSIHLFQLPP